MAIYFADASFWIALVDRRDAHHLIAVEWSLKISGQIVTTEAVLLETVNAFSRPDWRDKVIALVDHILGREDVEVVPMTQAAWERAWKLFKERSDKSWSLTDCMSFDVMRERGLVDALTGDSHFAQAGFHALFVDKS